MVFAASEPDAQTPGGDGERRRQLGFASLARANDPIPLLDYHHYARPAGTALPPGNHFSGRLRLLGTATRGRFREHRDRFGYTGSADDPRKHLPALDTALLQVGDHIFPLQRGSIASDHPYWEFVLAPGRVWDEYGDHGFSRVALPFALQQKNANCIHNGVMTFLFRDDGTVSDVAYQVAGETCAYYQVDLWGRLGAEYIPADIPGEKELAGRYRAELERRLPTRPISELQEHFPAADSRALAAPAGKDARAMSLVGYVIDGIHYTAGCATRQGQFPFCDSLIVPSYSVAKSVFAGGALMRLEQKYPGTVELDLAGLVPECASGPQWHGITLDHALDMATGNFDSLEYMADEGAEHTDGLFLSTSHRAKMDYSCGHYTRKAVPGTTWAYHTSDHYLLGTAMNQLLRQKEGRDRDIFTDILYREVLKPLGVSATAAFTRRTYDAQQQPFTGWGLVWLRDDVAKIGQFFTRTDGGPLDSRQLDAAMQRESNDPGVEPLPGYRYNNGFWAREISEHLEGCERQVWVPFMSGYGGVVVLLLPNESTYYYFADDDSYEWLAVAVASHGIRSLCP